MDYKYIEQLLNRYFEAETTLKEEQILKAFFTQEDDELPEGLRQFKGLFVALEPEDVLSNGFDSRILAAIGRGGEEYGEPTVGEEQGDTTVKAQVISLSETMRPLLRAAAAVAIILTLSTAINQSFRDDDVWTDEDQIARYQDELRKAALAAATSDSVMLFSEGIGVKTDSLMNDSLRQVKGGYFE